MAVKLEEVELAQRQPQKLKSIERFSAKHQDMPRSKRKQFS